MMSAEHINGAWRFLWRHLRQKTRHLYNLRTASRELNDLAEQEPQKLSEMKREWDAYAKSVGYIEANGTKQLDEMTAQDFFTYKGLN